MNIHRIMDRVIFDSLFNKPNQINQFMKTYSIIKLISYHTIGVISRSRVYLFDKRR